MSVTFFFCAPSPTKISSPARHVTVPLEVPLCPSLVAVIVADPAAAAVTSPLPSTLATHVLLLDHVTARPASGVPLASFGVAESCPLLPPATPAHGGATPTNAYGATPHGTLTLA